MDASSEDFPQSPSKRARLDLSHSPPPNDPAANLDDPDDFYDDDQQGAPLDKEGLQEEHTSSAVHAVTEQIAATSVAGATDGLVSPLPGLGGTQQLVSPTLPGAEQKNGDVQGPDPALTAVPEMQKEGDVQATAKEGQDAEFLEAAKQNKENKSAEWRFDSSDAEDSSDDSSDSSSDDSSEDDSDEDDEEVLLDPAEAARMLMKEEGGEDEERVPKGPVKTVNEIDATFEKPDITVTADMAITELGTVDNIIGNMALVKANTTGEYRVLESGSLLCLPDRRVIGVVYEPLGRVHTPMYSVGFPQASDMEELGIVQGQVVFYVEAHSTYVFTQSIKNLKGSDASNMHDEEVYGEEIEFSDDEAEAEYKRSMKQAKQAKKAAAQGVQAPMAFGGRGPSYNQSGPSHISAQAASYPTAISYDDDAGEAEDDMYKPLARPDNLTQMMGDGAPPLERRNFDNNRPIFNGRGRGNRGRGRGRGDRGGRGVFRNQGRDDGGRNRYQHSESSDYHQQNASAANGIPAPPPAWSQGASQYPNHSFNNAPQAALPPPLPPAALINSAFFAQQSQAHPQPPSQQQPFDPQAWAQYLRQQQQFSSLQQQQQPPTVPQHQQPPGQSNVQAAQTSLQNLLHSLTQPRAPQ